jgi:hypothetical protein
MQFCLNYSTGAHIRIIAILASQVRVWGPTRGNKSEVQETLIPHYTSLMADYLGTRYQFGHVFSPNNLASDLFMKASSSNLGQNTDHPDWRLSYISPHPKAYAAIVLQDKSWPLLFTSSQNYCSISSNYTAPRNELLTEFWINCRCR